MNLSPDLLLSIYRNMLRIRLCEESFIAPILSGDIKTPCHLYSGQEAVAVGVCANLSKDDLLFGNHRSHGHYLAKGGDMKEMVAEIMTKESGCSRGRGGSMHLINPQCGMLGSAPIVAGTISLAVGAALAISIRGENKVAVSFFGDGAAGEGVLYESLNFAALHKLPLLFVCENNFYSTHMPISECRVEYDIYKIASPFGINSYQVDGNDVLEVHKECKNAISQCRNGKGPVFIECLTYRMRGHVGPDDNIQGTHTDIRPEEEIENWRRKDPIKRFEHYLLENKLSSIHNLDIIRAEIEKEISDAHSFAGKSSLPNHEEVRRYVFA